MKDENKKILFPASCNCKIEVIGKNLIISPCSLDCKVYKYIIEESSVKGHIVSYHVEKDGR